MLIARIAGTYVEASRGLFLLDSISLPADGWMVPGPCSCPGSVLIRSRRLQLVDTVGVIGGIKKSRGILIQDEIDSAPFFAEARRERAEGPHSFPVPMSCHGTGSWLIRSLDHPALIAVDKLDGACSGRDPHIDLIGVGG